MKIIPINNHLIVRPVKQETAFASSQQTYEERGEVIEGDFTQLQGKVKKGSYVYFDSWCAAKYLDGDGNEFWVVPFEKIRAVETDD